MTADDRPDITIDDIARLLDEVCPIVRKGGSTGKWFEDRGLSFEVMDKLTSALSVASMRMLARGTDPAALSFEMMLTVFMVGWECNGQFGRRSDGHDREPQG